MNDSNESMKIIISLIKTCFRENSVDTTKEAMGFTLFLHIMQ